MRIMSLTSGSARQNRNPRRWCSATCPHRMETASSMCTMISVTSWSQKAYRQKKSPISTRQTPKLKRKNCSARCAPVRCVCCSVLRRKWAQEPMCKLSLWHSIIWIVRGDRLTCSSVKAESSVRVMKTPKSIFTPMSPRTPSTAICISSWNRSRSLSDRS